MVETRQSRSTTHSQSGLRLVADSPYIGTVRALVAISGVKFESTVHAWLKQAEPKRDALKRIADAGTSRSIGWSLANYMRSCDFTT